MQNHSFRDIPVTVTVNAWDILLVYFDIQNWYFSVTNGILKKLTGNTVA